MFGEKDKEIPMISLEQFYSSVGADANEVVSRLGGSADLVRRFVKKFMDDTCFADLLSSLEKNDTQAAFRAVHTLKGVAVNLGMQTLFVKASEVTELLRAGKLEEGKKAVSSLEEEYFRVRKLVQELE